MAQQIINDDESGLNVRTALNSMFGELYGALVIPVKLPGLNANSIQAIPANCFVSVISISPSSGTPTLRIGITPNGEEILEDTVINSFNKVQSDQYFSSSGSLYFTFSGTAGSVNVRLDLINNYN